MVQLSEVAQAVKSAIIHNKEKAMQEQQLTGHKAMAARIHSVFSQGQGVPVSSAQAEMIVEMKLWLAAIANGQLKIVDTAEAPPLPDIPSDGLKTN